MMSRLSGEFLKISSIPDAFLAECTTLATAPLTTQFRYNGVERIHEIVRSYANSALHNPPMLSAIANSSYAHPLGFEKLVLWDGVAGERIRLHIWRGDACQEASSDIHDHYWDFRSIVLRGWLTFSEYEVVTGDDSYSAYQMDPIGNGSHVLRFIGKQSLTLQRVVTLTVGGQYALSSNVLHATHTPHSCISLVAQSARRKDSNVVYRHLGPTQDIENSNVPLISMEALRGSLEELSRIGMC